MTKILLVDDEDFIRQGIRYTIPWEKHNLEVFEASNGKEALDLALRINPDIVLADIQMPVMDGLELARRLKEPLPETRVIILTAYGNTKNLLHAIDANVSGFLFKSADSSQILDTVLKLKAELDVQKFQNEKLSQIQGIYNENKALIKSTLLSRFLNNQISLTHFFKKGTELGMDLQRLPLALVVVKCNTSKENLVIGQLLQCFHEYSPQSFFTQNHIAVTLLRIHEKVFNYDVLNQLVPYFAPYVFGNFITAMAPVNSYEELPIAFNLLSQSLEFCFWNFSEPFLMLTPQTHIAAYESPVPYDYEKAIMKAINKQETCEISSAFSSYYQYMKAQKASRSVFLDSVLRIVVLISSILKEDIDIQKINELIHETESPEEILDIVESLVSPACTKVSHSQIDAALSYMQEHFTENLYLKDVAKAVYLSPGYLCRIFKNETGYSFKEYLHKLRIEKAQQLIRDTDYKYYEIAEMVGYKNYKYFSSYFSKIAGCAAKEYRLSVQK